MPDRLKQAEQEIQKINQAYEVIKDHIQDTLNFNDAPKFDNSPKIKTQKADASYHYDLGVELAEQENYQAAIAEFSQAIKLNSNYIKAYQYRGFILSKLGYEYRADADFRKVATLKYSSQKKYHNSNYYSHCQDSNHRNQKTNNKNYTSESKTNFNNIDSGNCIRTILAHKSAISSIVVSNDNRLLITGSHDKSIKLWELSTGQIIDTLRGHSDGITCLAISDDNKTIISGSKDKTIRFWDVQQRKVIKTFGRLFSGHSKDIVSIVLDNKNNVLISADADKSIKIWNLNKNKEIKTINCKSGQITSLAINHNRGYFCNGGLEKQIRIRKTQTGEVIRSLRGTAAVTALTFSNDGNLLATGEINRKIRIFDLTTGKIIKTFLGHTDRISSLVFSSDSKQLISGSWDNKIKLWDIEKEVELETLTSHKGRILFLALTSDDKIISTNSDCSIKIWQPKK